MSSLDKSFNELDGQDRAPVDLGWQELGFVAGKKHIIKGVSGTIRSGELCAIMGPSGAGKSSFMNILAIKTRTGGGVVVTGTITANGKRVDPTSFRRKIAYVMQEDALFATQTPMEALSFSAKLRLSKTIPSESIGILVNTIIDSLGLRKCAHTYIGNIMIKGISGGEKKRTAIGVELVANPQILFLDEPTSGLDSYAAFQVVKILKTLSRSGRTVITTIHQPSSEVFEIFDNLLLLANGQIVYHDAVATMPAYFGQLGHVCPPNYNPADYVMFMLQQLPMDGIEDLAKEWDAKAKAKAKVEVVVDIASPKNAAKADKAERNRVGFCTQFCYLAKRELDSLQRDKIALIARVVTTAFLNLIIGVVFQGAADWSNVANTPVNLLSKANSHFGAIVQVAIGGMFGLSQPTLLAFPLERPVFLREYAVGTYDVLPYFLSKMLIEVPVMIGQSAIIFLCTYWLVGFSANFMTLTCLTALLGLVASSTSLLIGALSSDVQVAIQLTPLLFVPQLLFAGFFIAISEIPVWLQWSQYLCSLKYALDLLMIVEFGARPPTLSSSVTDDQYYEVIYGCSGSNLTSDWVCVNKGPLYDIALFPRTDVFRDKWYIYLGILLAVLLLFRSLALCTLVKKARG